VSRFSSAFLVQATAGRVTVSAPFGVERVGKDTREDLTGALYVAIRGENFDGHDYVAEAFAGGASAAMVAEDRAAALADQGPLLVVADPESALLDLASAHMERSTARRLALTGSNGKTTTKEMIAAICRRAHGAEAVHATAGNLNNLIGMPLTALGIEENTAVAILEMGMNRPGEIAAMAAATRPEVGLIVNVQPAHLEGLGDLAAVARAKGELFAALAPQACAVVNLDDSHCRELGAASAARKISFGVDAVADVRLEQAEPIEAGQRIRLRIRGAARELRLRHAGRHNALNAAAAAACGCALNLDADTICAGLEAAPVVSGRLAQRQVGPLRLIDDSYNANPASMRAALAVAAERAAAGHLHVVFGEMRELGAAADDLHAEVGGAVAAVTPARAWFCGAHAEAYRRGAAAAGLADERITCAGDAAELAAAITDQLEEGDLVLIKGSRGARMERVVERVEHTFGTPAEDR